MGVVLDPVLSGKRGITMFHLTVPLTVDEWHSERENLLEEIRRLEESRCTNVKAL